MEYKKKGDFIQKIIEKEDMAVRGKINQIQNEIMKQ